MFVFIRRGNVEDAFMVMEAFFCLLYFGAILFVCQVPIVRKIKATFSSSYAGALLSATFS